MLMAMLATSLADVRAGSPTAGWHQLSLELRAGRLRIYVDDACLGRHKMPALNGVRISSDAGKLWIDELIVTQRLPAGRIPTDEGLRHAWLARRATFRQLLAPTAAVTLDSKLGSARFHGPTAASFCSGNGIDRHERRITFRPASGFPPDQLRAKLVRWEDGKLIIQHELFGEFALERDRLDKIRWLPK